MTEFADAVAELTGEPALSKRQADLVESVTIRLCNGPRMSVNDVAALNWAARVLGMQALFGEHE